MTGELTFENLRIVCNVLNRPLTLKIFLPHAPPPLYHHGARALPAPARDSAPPPPSLPPQATTREAKTGVCDVTLYGHARARVGAMQMPIDVHATTRATCRVTSMHAVATALMRGEPVYTVYCGRVYI